MGDHLQRDRSTSLMADIIVEPWCLEQILMVPTVYGLYRISEMVKLNIHRVITHVN